MTGQDPTELFDEISEYDSKALFKPKVVSLVVSNGEDAGPNVMTASWYMLAGYNPFRYLLAVSHKTHTYELIEESQEFVLAAPSKGMVDALTLSGMVSGRDIDKIAHLGIETVPGQSVDVPLLADATGNIECSVMDSFEFMDTTYYFGEVEHAYVTPGGLDGRILSPDADVLAYMGSDWGEEETVSKYRHYADITADSMERFPGDEVVESLPEALREELSE
ncbi:flavin reductase family protein [Haloarcula onubensis]|uniref:Flavin reductase family protein n=1 Tax=Haloarcula onubensis TaxID=2950539 RepID=A0ABU2FLN6_9EURY|nr:flavin reductase family protein [Halomicroarcula sp. S3CR25-11]MDS0281645.1 flavin reductase family protein [Halomicroarcula sp. S3CR25-11]